MDDVTIIISAFMRDDALWRCLDSIEQTYPGIRVIVADDGHHTPEKTAEMACRGVRYIPMPFDSGLGAKRNRMIDEVETPYTVLMDDDMLLTETANLSALKTLMEIVDIAGATLYYPDRNRRRTFAATMKFRPDDLVCTGIRTPLKKYDRVSYNRADLVLNCFMAKTEVLQAIRWDERFKITYEHIDFFIRATLAGVRVATTPDAEFTEYKERTPEYRSYRLRIDEHEKIFYQKYGFNKLVKTGIK